MHIEKNVFENIFNTVMNVKGKTKDNIKARLDVELFCNHKNMELVCDGSRVAKPRASFVLEKNTKLLVYKWLKSLHFLDGHALNISRLVNTEECRLYGMKSVARVRRHGDRPPTLMCVYLENMSRQRIFIFY
jgi:hypothetical protein